MPAPVAPMAHASGAWMLSRPQVTVSSAPAAASFSFTGSTSATCGVVWISATCVREATSRASFSVPPLTSTALAIG